MKKKPLLCGVDEAGRGPLAGPVTAAAVILPEDFPVELLNDSKKIRPLQREKVSRIIKEKALAYSTGWVWPEEIDKINIHRASLLAMLRAIRNLAVTPDEILIDGAFTPPLNGKCRAIVKGDTLIHEIMAASIIAKTARDKWMERYARIEPAYQFEKHKGYPTLLHRQLIQKLGYSAIHRKSFTFSCS